MPCWEPGYARPTSGSMPHLAGGLAVVLIVAVFAVVVRGVVVFDAAFRAIPIAGVVTLAVMTGLDPVGAGVGGAGPISCVPFVMAA